MLGRITKFVIGLLVIPIAIAISIAFFKELSDIEYSSKFSNSEFFLWGVVTYAAMHLLLFKPKYLYTVGHEATHAFSTLLCGGRVTSFRVSKEGGRVSTTKNNFFISLSPYFVPFYTLAISLAYFSGSIFYNLSYLSTYFIFLIGFSLAFHIISTAEVLKIEQPDILKTGYLFSIALIYAGNIILIAFIICLMFKEPSFESFLRNSYTTASNMYMKIFNQLFGV